MAKFNPAVSELLEHEQGYQDNPSDDGNYDDNNNLIGTNWGITPRTYYRYYGEWPTKRQMETLPATDAIEIYYNLYWLRYSLGTIQDQAVADHVLDTLVLHYYGAELIQTAINAMNVPLVIDNIYGSDTAAAVYDLSSNPHTAKKFNDTLVNVRLNYVDSLVQANPDWLQFIIGWKKRIRDFWSGSKAIKIGVVVALITIPVTLAFPGVRRFLGLPF